MSWLAVSRSRGRLRVQSGAPGTRAFPEMKAPKGTLGAGLK